MPSSVDVTFECNICNKVFKQKRNLRGHLNDVHGDETSFNFVCFYCEKRFKRNFHLKRHIRTVHHVDVSENRESLLANVEGQSSLNPESSELQLENSNSEKKKQVIPIPKFLHRAHIKCIECNTKYSNMKGLRTHLTAEHNLNMESQEFQFPNMAAFTKWKHDLERRELVLYTKYYGFKKSKNGRKTDYFCHRSGKHYSRAAPQRKRMLKTTGSIKLGITCTSVIVCEDCPTGVNVQYFPHHYGHGKELSFVHLSAAELNAIEENVSKGMPFENLLDDIKDNQSTSDYFQVCLLKQKASKFISNAYTTNDYNPGLGEVESVDQWVRQCCEMENSPILFYRPENTEKSKKTFLLIIMTEFQKQILMSSSKQVVCVDTVEHRKSGGFFCSVLMVMDDNDIAFPVAFCFSNKVDQACMYQFFLSIQDSVGPLSFAYFMSNSEEFIYETWREVMGDENSKWLWSKWFVESRIGLKLRVFRGKIVKKSEAYKTLKTLLECQNVNVFETIFNNFVETLKSDPNSRSAGEYVNQKYSKHAHLWAYCYRKDIPLSTNIHLEVLHRTFHFVCRQGRKKRRDKFFLVVMKLLRYKMLDRLSNILDEEKIELAIEAINLCHNEGLEITGERILSLSDKIWLIEGDEDEPNIYVTREFEACPEHCSLRCKECDICVHMYTCSCIHSVINANMCPHIHAVVWKFLTPHFSPPPSPMADDIEEQENIDVPVIPDKCSELLDEILNKSHDVYKIVRENKCNLPKKSLTAILKRLNECIDIGKGKRTVDVVDTTTANNAQNVYNIVLPENSQDLSQYILILPDSNETVTPIVPNDIVLS